MRESLARHLDALLAEPLPKIELDGALVAAARATFSRVSLAERVYSRIRPSAEAQRIPPWRPADALGPAGVRLFMRASGKPLTDGIPGFYTVEGFHRVLLPALGGAAKEVASESWVLGEQEKLNPRGPELRNLERDVIHLYEADYARFWDAMLADLNIIPLRNPQQAAQDLYVLASPQSPMRDLLTSMARQLTLSQPPTAPGGGGAATATQAVAQHLAPAQQAADRLQGVIGTAEAAESPPSPPPGSEIDERYKAFRDYVGSGPNAPIDQTLKALNDLQQQVARRPAGGAGGSAPTGGDPGIALRAAAATAPPPVARALLAMASSANAVRSGDVHQQVKEAFNGPGGPGPLCRQIVSGRFPFLPNSSADSPLDDVAKLFAPGGMIDGFFNAQLRPYVDTSGRVWRAQAVDGVAPPVAPADLAQFQRAAVIRDIFFGPGGNTPTVRFDITPAELDSGARQVTLALGSTEIRYAFGPPVAHQVTWPGPDRMAQVRLVFDPPSPGGTGVVQASGPWALFRLFAQGSLQRDGSSDRYTLHFHQGERQAAYTIQAGSVLNPFDSSVLQAFRCPSMQ
ncbi:MAG: type VI secretion system membrane subunit TssM [Acetobacteraceae bacterium]|nr:type VI secretion system membrane subunit TssM [Acetobacteraceae bacterium]